MNAQIATPSSILHDAPVDMARMTGRRSKKPHYSIDHKPVNVTRETFWGIACNLGAVTSILSS